ncbi:prolyl oligopeptidase family serine peptidase [Acidianus sulfidivorans JP7]|uniref:prolyl oligopeptidase n=1 Tax=Acidianus sulfidivorans JP7 TaxID=619593 RepID=A0A2U9IM16_9CREN|nr:prolyl oligopeptidase family serine peptidase [Acidianus sulfidivorans]AWR96954.1 prolyl oligopeptidase family serine peptidase [Acidianus sulfidivorans JP7]
MEEVDKYQYLENLDDPRTKEFIEKTNNETTERFGKEAYKVYNSILSILKEDNPISILALKDRALVLFYGNKNSIASLEDKREIYTASEGYVISSLQRVYNKDNEFAITIGKKGSDKTRLILLPENKVIDEMADNPFYINKELCYVKTYAYTKPPDGGEFPSQRIICNGEIVYGKDLKPGQFISVKVIGDEILLVKSNGWRWEELYYGEDLSNLRKIDEGEVIIPIKEGPIYIKNNTIKAGKPVKVEYPIIDATAGTNFIALEVIKNYRTSIVFLEDKEIKEGNNIALSRKEENYDNVVSMDAYGDNLYLIETSFNFRYRLYKNMNVLLESKEKEDFRVSDIYVNNGEVTLHGFLLSQSINPKGIIVYGYGGFRVSLLPFYSVIFSYLLKNGYSVLITNLRGGYENGEEWHKDGMLLNKKNVFKDFEKFIEVVKSIGGKVIAMGGSNGGLLVGATINDIPNYVDCAIISHPVLDMMRYHELYVGKYWVEEYGNPDDPKYRDYLLSYSPYHNIKEGLPNTLVITGINDDRVHPAHALKYVMKRKVDFNDKNVFLLTLDKGHAISDPESTAQELSYEIAFIEECTKK